MITAARECPSCRAALPADAAFCHKCGTSTPTGINQATGEIQALERSGLAESERLAAVQEALGDPCEVRRLLGRGGFAEVYVAFDKRLKREIAVKTIRGDLVVNEMLLERFQREAEAVAKLRHPNVMPIYSVGENRGVAYFTMPLIEGESLAAALEREGRLSVREGVRILRESSLALHAAHRAGIVHRDVKPDNIMLEGPERSVVVMDFGIAKSAGDEVKGLTGTGMLIGTPHYMSPEQATGERTLDARSDQYSLATVGYRMLTGRATFEGESIQALIFKILTEVPPPACELSPDIPKEVSDVLAKALSKRPEDRYESMAAFAASLAPFEHASRKNAKTARRRARLDLATRIRAMRATVPRLRASILAAVPVGAAAIALGVLATPRVPLVMAGNRQDAIFAATSFLNARGVAGGRDEYVDFISQDSAFRFLQKQLGFAGMQQRAMTDVPVWQWRIHSVSPTARDEWRVWVGPENRIVGFEHSIPDHAMGVRLSADSARSLAEGELASRGWPVSRLERLPDSTINRNARTDYVFRWKQLAGAVPWRGHNAAYVRLSVIVAGDRIVRFSHDLKIPEGFLGEFPHWLGVIFANLALLLMVLAVIVTRRRNRMDELQWGSMIRLSGFVAVALLIISLPELYESAMTARAVGGDARASIGAFLGPMVLLGGSLWVAVAGESLMYSRKPEVVAGISDIARARLIIPEIVPAAIYGYLFGALFSLGEALDSFVELRLGIGSQGGPLGFSRIPFVESLFAPPVVALGTVFVLMFAVALFVSVPYVWKGVLVGVTILTGIVLWVLGYGGAADQLFAACAAIALLTYALWRYGALSAIIAVIVSYSIDQLVNLIRVGDAPYVLGAAASLAVIATPAVLAILSLRRFSKPEGIRGDLRARRST